MSGPKNNIQQPPPKPPHGIKIDGGYVPPQPRPTTGQDKKPRPQPQQPPKKK